MSEVISTWTNDEIDKAAWGDGPWLSEPDKVQWIDQDTGYTCLIVRNPGLGQLNGYVAVPPGHPAYGKGEGELDVEVHGGITYAALEDEREPRDDWPWESMIILEGRMGQRMWMIGFDTGHWSDLQPGMRAMMRNFPAAASGTYRTLGYVQKECANLARQIADYTPRLEESEA